MQYEPRSRRFFLRGLGGFLLAAPFMPSLLPRAVKAQGAGKPAMRFAMMLSQYGRDILRWSPPLSDDQLTRGEGGVYSFPLADIEGPISYIIDQGFDPVRSKLSIVQGLDELAPYGLHNSSLPTTGSARPPDGASGFGYSIDCVLEESQKFYPTPVVAGALRTVPGDASYMWRDHSSFSWTSKSRHGEFVKAQWSPQAIYDRYFNPQALEEAGARNARIKHVTDRVFDNYQSTLRSRRISADDRRRLDHYMSLMSQVDSALAITPPACERASDPGAAPEQPSAVHSAMIDMEVAALACGTTKIVMHSVIHGGDQAGDMHGPAHAGPGRDATLESPVSTAAIQKRWQLGRVSEFLRKLDAIEEADGSTLLDNTLFIYSNEDGDGSHEHIDIPVLVAGGQGKLRLGYYMDLRPRPFNKGGFKRALGRPYNQLLVTAFKALGLQGPDYHKFGGRGFGPYDVQPNANAAHYAPFLTDPDAPLPFLYTG